MPAICDGPYSGIVHLGLWRLPLRRTATTLFLLTLAFLAVACSSSNDTPGGGVSVSPVTREPGDGSPNPTAVSGATAEPTAANNGNALTGFSFPIQGGCLPKGDQLMPNAPRTYRRGVHEGVDMYQVDNCTSIGLGTQVRAAKAGRVIRVDTNYQDPTPQQMSALLANPEPEASLDSFRGRQVWVDHGGGIVTRYCHLSSVAQGLAVGQQVNAGDVIAYVGESGTPESVSNPGNEYHLHFEVRVGNSYLGAGESPQRVRQLYTALFAP
ncbi:MAG TPA: M23 family metallopeptidase [Dehalococcoidia bacterium]|nr:M23 family metallopeptidase [Dehalococcoidia bacterium]